MPPWVTSLLSWISLPVYVVQGLIVRSRVRILPPATGPTRFEHQGAEPTIRLLVVGDSTVAGVGVETTEQGLAAQTAAMVAGRTGRALVCQSIGLVGATTDILCDHAKTQLPDQEFSHVVISVGTNDAKNFRMAPRFEADLTQLLAIISGKWPNALIVWPTIVDMRAATSLPSALGQIIEWRSLLPNEAGKRACARFGAHATRQLEISDPAAFFSPDGFHVSKEGCRQCAEVLADAVLARQ